MVNLVEMLTDEYWEDSKAMNKIKYTLCGDHWFGNIFAPLWLTTSCTCCAFFRGVLLGVLIGGSATCILQILY